MANGSVEILHDYRGHIIVITGKVADNVFQIGDAWVWNGIGTPQGGINERINSILERAGL